MPLHAPTIGPENQVFEESVSCDHDHAETITTSEAGDGTELRVYPDRLLDRTVTTAGLERTTAGICRDINPGDGARVVIDVRQCDGVPATLVNLFVVSLARKFDQIHAQDLLVDAGDDRPPNRGPRHPSARGWPLAAAAE